MLLIFAQRHALQVPEIIDAVSQFWLDLLLFLFRSGALARHYLQE